MPNLTKRWPLGLDRRNWPDFATAVILMLFALVFVDVWASQTFQAWPDVWKAPFAFITHFGLSDWVLIPSLALFVLAAITYPLIPSGLYRRAVYELGLVSSFIFIGVGLPGLLTNLLKRLFGRARPAEFLEAGAFHFQVFFNEWNFQSFPSGHAATAVATAFLVGFMAPRFFRLVLLVAVMTGLSRIVIGMHYPTDVAAGFIIGMLGAYGVRNYYARRRWLFAPRPDGTVRFRGMPNLRLAMRRGRQRARA